MQTVTFVGACNQFAECYIVEEWGGIRGCRISVLVSLNILTVSRGPRVGC